jgi:hypothetical protein
MSKFKHALHVVLLIGSPFVAGTQAAETNVVIQWNQAALQGVRDSTLGPPMVARALAIMHTCAYDAFILFA